MNERRLFVVTGISGAGKSQALKVFEDFGFYCVDNLPVALITGFAELLGRRGRTQRRDVALGIDIRGGEFLRGFAASLETLRELGWTCRVLFLDASDRVVVQRYSETRHRHPLGAKTVLAGVREERRRLAEIKSLADKIIDTSDLTLGELKEKLSRALGTKAAREMNLSVVSFGYKHGIPLDADLVMDVRFLPNPNYQAKLKPRNGLDAAVQGYILRQPPARAFLERYEALIKSLLPHYAREGKSYLTVAVGCTGGRHRSVFVTHHLARALKKDGYPVHEYHRDLGRA